MGGRGVQNNEFLAWVLGQTEEPMKMSSVIDVFSVWYLWDMQVVKQIEMTVWHSKVTSSQS